MTFGSAVPGRGVEWGRNCIRQKGGQPPEQLLGVAVIGITHQFHNVGSHSGGRYVGIVGQQKIEESAFDLLVGVAQCIEACFVVVASDGEISALINHRDGVLVNRVHVAQALWVHFPSFHIFQPHVGGFQPFGQKGWGARLEPVIVDVFLAQGPSSGCRVVKIDAIAAESVAVVGAAQGFSGLGAAHLLALRQLGYGLAEVAVNLVFRHTAKGLIFFRHGYVGEVVQLAEYAHLCWILWRPWAEPGTGWHPGFQRAVEGFEHHLVVLLQRFVGEAVNQRLVIFVNQHRHLLSRYLPGPFYHPLKRSDNRGFAGFAPVGLFPSHQRIVQHIFQRALGNIFIAVEADVQYGVDGPVLSRLAIFSPSNSSLRPDRYLSRVDSSSVLPNRRGRPRKIIFTRLAQLVDDIRLVNVDESPPAYFFKIL